MYLRAVLFGLLALVFASCGSDGSSDAKSLVNSIEDLSDGQDGLDSLSGSSGSRHHSSGSRHHRSSSSKGTSGSSSGHSHGQNNPGYSSSSYVPPKDVIDDPVVEDTTTVTDVEALPACTATNEGETFMVNSEKMLYFCVGGSWVPYSSVEQLYKISCKDGVVTLEELAPAAAPGYGGFGGYGGGTTVSSGLDTLDVRIAGANIVGVAEKGPFRYGASVKITELDSAQRLADSRLTHAACITGADGRYQFEGIDLRSPYLRVEASGVYRSELSGGMSAKEVTLKAIVDITDRDTVNVNMLTHMEAPRVQKLVEDSGNNKPIRSVKAQALREILSSFNISLGGSGATGGGGGGMGGWGFSQQQQTTTTTDGRFAEDIGLFDGDEYSGALLAISIMMQRKGSGNDMLQYTSGIAERIKGNGNWDDNNAKADLADWLMVLDTSGTYDFVRHNMDSWNLGPVPEFEKHLRNFWTGVYQFGSCNSMTAGTVKYVNNSLSKYFISYYEQPEGPRVRFICDAETHLWRSATDIEKDTVGFGRCEYDGQLKAGVINKDRFYYCNTKTGWREATSDDIQEFEDIKDVYAKLGAGEKVIFVLRHAERTDDTGKNGHLTNNGKTQSKTVGAKLKGEDISFANSTYTRSYETCESFAEGAGVSPFVSDTIPELVGEWFVKDDAKLENYKNSNDGGWTVTSAYAYKGSFADAFYPLESRNEEFINDIVLPRFSSVKRVAVWISHDTFVVPITVYGTNKKVNLRYFETKQWINYLAGVAIIMGTDGKLRYVPVKGLDSGTMTM